MDKTFVLFAFLLLTPVATALTCTLRGTPCLSNETCLFSVFNTGNAHVGVCGYYGYNVCCDEIISYTNQTCNASTASILSFYQRNNTHVAQANYYSWQLCAGYSTYPLECSIKGSCETNETCVVSLYGPTNSHVGSCDYYGNKLCCGKLPDLYVNSSSITLNESAPVVGDVVELNITVWNVGDAAAPNVNVSCYENGTYFGSDLINAIPPDPSMQTPRYATCYWTVSCNNNLSVIVDPANEIKELNETNNQAWNLAALTDKLFIQIDSPINGSSYYRGETLSLQSTVTGYCVNPTSYTVNWYNESTPIGTGEDITWLIPLDDGLLGTKTIKASVSAAGYQSAYNTSNITILNNLPVASEPYYNVTPAEILQGDAIEIYCDVTDVEDSAASLQVNLSVRDPVGQWSNETATILAGNTFYRVYSTDSLSPLGNYTTYCSAVDTDDGFATNSSQFLVYSNLTIIISLNSTAFWWEEGVNVSVNATRNVDNTQVAGGDVVVRIEDQLKCSATLDANGAYDCITTAPSAIGNYTVYVSVTDPQTGKTFTNTTTLVVKAYYGETEESIERSESVACYEFPSLVRNPDGSIKRIVVRICVPK